MIQSTRKFSHAIAVVSSTICWALKCSRRLLNSSSEGIHLNCVCPLLLCPLLLTAIPFSKIIHFFYSNRVTFAIRSEPSEATGRKPK